MHNGEPMRSPVIIYHHTVRGTNSTPLHSGLHADYNGILSSHCTGRAWRTSLFGSAPYRRFSLATAATNVSCGGRHPPAPLPRRSYNQVEACCTARIARAAWRTDEASTLIGANRSTPGVPKQAYGTGAALGQSPEHSMGVRCGAIHIAGFRSRLFHSSARYHRMHQ